LLTLLLGDELFYGSGSESGVALFAMPGETVETIFEFGGDANR
jgi:hypothetical protein